MEHVVAAAGCGVPTSICGEIGGMEIEAIPCIHLLADGGARCALAIETSQGRAHGIALAQQLDDAPAADEARPAGHQHCPLFTHGCSSTSVLRFGSSTAARNAPCKTRVAAGRRASCPIPTWRRFGRK